MNDKLFLHLHSVGKKAEKEKDIHHIVADMRRITIDCALIELSHVGRTLCTSAVTILTQQPFFTWILSLKEKLLLDVAKFPKVFHQLAFAYQYKYVL